MGKLTATYQDTVHSSGNFNFSAIMQIAVMRTRAEVAGFARIGRPRSFRSLIAGELRLVWQSAKSIRASVMAGIERDSLSPTERRARRLELQAEIAESAIPSRNLEARALRLRAAQLREPKFMEAAE